MKEIGFSDEHRKRIDDFFAARTFISDRKIATRFHDSDAHVYDLKFIRPHLRPGMTVLDLGTGSGILAHESSGIAGRVIAVDKFSEFFDPTYKASNIEFVKSDVLEFSYPEQFDLVLLFGVVTYLDYEQSERLYDSVNRLLKDGGTLLAKHGCGVEEDVFVDGFSEHFQSHYVALYKHLQNEKRLLEKYFDVDAVDIYPDHLNRWTNTRYYGFICRKPKSAEERP
ncbi:MAG: class I SAM-dependent methyltransferase [Pseudomonadota bacterium]